MVFRRRFKRRIRRRFTFRNRRLLFRKRRPIMRRRFKRRFAHKRSMLKRSFHKTPLTGSKKLYSKHRFNTYQFQQNYIGNIECQNTGQDAGFCVWNEQGTLVAYNTTASNIINVGSSVNNLTRLSSIMPNSTLYQCVDNLTGT